MSRRAAIVEAIDGLVLKYRTLVALRSGREAAEAGGQSSFDAEQGRVRREKMRGLACSHPGSLRELDSFDAMALAARLQRCEAEQQRLAADPVLEDTEDALVGCLADYHRILRHLLWLKLRLGAKSGVLTDASVEALRREYAEHGPPGVRPWPLDGLDRQALERLARPPGGRLHLLVYAALDGRHGLTSREIELLLFGRPNR